MFSEVKKVAEENLHYKSKNLPKKEKHESRTDCFLDDVQAATDGVVLKENPSGTAADRKFKRNRYGTHDCLSSHPC
jgi:hypothetical protein